MMDWKGIAEKTIVAVLAGVLLGCLGWFVTTITAPRQNPLTVTARWVDIPNPLFNVTEARVQSLDSGLLTAVGVDGLANFLRRMGYQPTGRLVTLRLQNFSDTRSKEIEVITKDGAVFSSDAETPPNTAVQSRLKIPPIDPGSKAIVYVAMPPWLDFEKTPINVLYDGKLSEVVTVQLPDEAEPFLYYIANYPFVFVTIFLIGLLTCLIFPISAFSQLLFAGRLKSFGARFTTKEQVQKHIDFIEYVRTNYPQNMPDAKDLPK